MACNLRRIANLPVQEEFKLKLLEFFQKPENAAACEKLNQASDEQLVALVNQIGQQMQGVQGGPPPEGMAPPAAGPMAPPPGNQGIASMQQPMRPQAPPGVPPGQVADIPKPMDTPLGIQGIPPRRM
jgi:hypothetical protein